MAAREKNLKPAVSSLRIQGARGKFQFFLPDGTEVKDVQSFVVRGGEDGKAATAQVELFAEAIDAVLRTEIRNADFAKACLCMRALVRTLIEEAMKRPLSINPSTPIEKRLHRIMGKIYANVDDLEQWLHRGASRHKKRA